MTMSEAIWQQIRAGREPSAAAIDELAAADPRSIGQASGAAVRNDLAVEVLGLGPLSTLAQDPSVTDILVNGTSGVWIDRGRGVEAAAVDVGEAETVRRLAVRLATMCGRRLDDSSPCVDGLLPGGIRLHAVLPPLVEEAAHLSLRIPARTSFSLAGLVEQGRLQSAMRSCCGNSSRRGSPSSSVAGLVRARRLCSARSCGAATRRTGCSSSRTCANCTWSTHMSFGWRRVLPISKAREPCRWRPWCDRPCGCGPIASSSVRCAEAGA